MTIEEIRNELQEKIKELEWRNNVRSLELIEWINSLLKKMEVKEEKKPEPIKVEVEEEEKPATPKKKIIFKKK
jgi:DNA-binding NtrC family response regulator